MAEVIVEQQEIVVRLSPLEKVGALSGDVRVPRSAVRDVRVATDPFSELRGTRSPGTRWLKRVAVGTWRRPGKKRDFVAIHRGQRAVVVDLTDESPKYERLLVSVADADQTRTRLTTT